MCVFRYFENASGPLYALMSMFLLEEEHESPVVEQCKGEV